MFITFWQIKMRIYGPGDRGLHPLRGLVHAMAWLCGKSIDLGIWNENHNRNEIWKKPVHKSQFFALNLDKKSQVWVFGTDLGGIWSVQIFGHLGRKQIMAGTH